MPQFNSSFLLGLLISLALGSIQADMLYEFKFQKTDGRKTLDNTGTVGGEATGVFARGTAPGAQTALEGEFTKDTPNPPANPWAYELPSDDGVHAMHLELPDSMEKLRLASEGDEMTIALWVKRNADPKRFGGLVANHVTDAGVASEEPNTGWAFGFADGSNAQFEEGQLVFMQGPIFRSHPGGRDVIPVGEWTHVAVVYKHDRSTDFYINGILVGSGGAFATPAPSNTAEIRVGRLYYSSGPLNGAIDNVQIFDAALPEEKIAELAKAR
jgi:hypothetical protein